MNGSGGIMYAKIKHVAIVANNPPLLRQFYRAAFGLSGDPSGEGVNASTDGYVALNVNLRAPGRQAGLDHFGLEVADVEEIRGRLQDDYPQIEVVSRGGSRGFAGFGMHDPAGNIFDLSPLDMESKKDVYQGLVAEKRHARRISHLVLRTVDPEPVARFYQTVFAFDLREKALGDPNYYLSDGTVTLVIAPWKLSDYVGTGQERPALDHLGFEVESLDAFQTELRDLAERNPALAPMSIKARGEGEARMRLLASCRYGAFHLPDPDGVLLDVSEWR
jgi:catechol 2,3-dioxygenase-like lactoylglutathione lyase family enzyme